ncbi:biotin synthase [Iodidimonas gelatinilytica]|uniref:Biotin synthase n=1 Tax=Iodidimonas gelatinilytica TaxID=1236966 RepID=A0A5A7MNS2_9PROT|nr:biotin synthase [Iodidimonas gelatinilytica]
MASLLDRSSAPDQAVLSDAPDFAVRSDWSREEIMALFALPFNDLVFRAAQTHRTYHDPNKVQLSQLLSIKTGGCAEDCAYCPQSAKFAEETGVKAEKLMDVERVLSDAKAAKEGGASRYCMGAAWTRLKDRDLPAIEEIVREVKGLGLETCMTLGMLERHQAERLRAAGLDYYNHNIDTSPEYYGEIITTRTFDERLETLGYVRDAGMNVCCGGIVGLGEDVSDRAGMLEVLARMTPHPESVPINMLVQVKGTALEGTKPLDPLEFVRTIAVARILMPKSAVRLSAGRETMSDECQALAFLAGANSIFYGEKLLTTDNPAHNRDKALFDRLGLQPA